MMSRISSSLQIDAAASFHSLGKGDLIQVAEEMAEMSQRDFDRIILAFEFYRRACQIEREQEAPFRRNHGDRKKQKRSPKAA